MDERLEEWQQTVEALDRRLVSTFTELSCWLHAPAEHFDRRPGPERWSMHEVLEHVVLADRYLLVIVRKLQSISERRLARGLPYPAHAPDLERLAVLLDHRHRWTHPAHMTPTGTLARGAIGTQLTADRNELRSILASLPPGAGTLHRIRMSVVPGNDRLDLYQYIALISLHAERHLAQLERNRRELTP